MKMQQRTIVTISIVMAMLMASIDTTILQTTMPIIADELGGQQWYAWTFTTYVLASTSLMPIAGRLADLFGRKRLFAFGLITFLTGSLLCGMSNSMTWLIFFRFVQGIGAGMMMPLVQIIAGDLYEVKDRGKIQALFTSMWMLSALLAPALGAVFVEFASWRWIFYINVPVCLLSLSMLVPYKDVYKAVRKPVDGVGALLFACGTGALLLITAVEVYRFVWVITGILLLLIFVWHERRHPAPMIPGQLLKRNTLMWMFANNFIICLALFGLPNYIPLYLQAQGYSVLASGLALIPLSLGWMMLSVQSGKWILRFGYRTLLLFGNMLVLLAAGLLLLSGISSYAFLLFVGLIFLGGSFGLIFTVSIIGAQQLVDPHDKGISTSLQMFVRNTGLAAGVSIMGLLLNQSESISSAMSSIYVYGFIGAILAMLVSWWIREPTSEAEVDQPLQTSETP